MGCAASKSLHKTIVPESVETGSLPVKKLEAPSVAPSAESSTCPALPPVDTKPLKPIAFEIPLDRDVLIFSKPGSHRIGHHGLPNVSLPKLERLYRSNRDTRKVGEYLDKLLDDTPVPCIKKETKLNNTYHTKAQASDPHSMTQLRQRLLDKEAQVAANRAKEIEKLQAKLARQEEHARRVQERKKAMEKLLLEGGDFAAFKRNEQNEEWIEKAAAAVSAAAEAVSKSMQEASQPVSIRRVGGTKSSTAGKGFRSTKNPGGHIIVGGQGNLNKYKNTSSDADSALGSSVNTSTQSSRGGSGRSETHVKDRVSVA